VGKLNMTTYGEGDSPMRYMVLMGSVKNIRWGGVL
jgi:hypothetical protein